MDRVFLCAIDWRACCLRAAPRWLCRSSPTCRTARSDARVSAIGLGGWHIGLNTISDALSMQIVRAAIDRGINFFDNSWDYNDGASETRMGKALRDGYRQNVFLMTKIDGRSKSEAARQLDESLRRLQTDCIDLVQHHEMLRFSRRARRGSCASSGSRDTRIHGSICTRSRWPANTASPSTRSRCR